MNAQKSPIYPIEPWHITEQGFEAANNYRNETTFSLSNGYIGTRGTFEEGYAFSVDDGLEGNFINGFYESETIRYGEWNFGFPETSQSLLNLPNLKTTRLAVGGEPFDLRTGSTETCLRRLDMQNGCVTRDVLWTSPDGRRLRVETVRLVSFAHKNLMAQRLRVTLLDEAGTLCFTSLLEADVENHTRKTNPLVDYGPYGRHLEPLEIVADADSGRMLYRGKTKNSGLCVACGSLHRLDCPSSKREETGTFSASLLYDAACKAGQSVTLDKFMVYASCRDMPESELGDFVKAELARAAQTGFNTTL